MGDGGGVILHEVSPEVFPVTRKTPPPATPCDGVTSVTTGAGAYSYSPASCSSEVERYRNDTRPSAVASRAPTDFVFCQYSSVHALAPNYISTEGRPLTQRAAAALAASGVLGTMWQPDAPLRASYS